MAENRPDRLILRTASIARAMARDLLSRAHGDTGPSSPAAAGPALVGEAGVALGKSYPLPEVGARMTIGRGPRCDVILLDPDLSREHAAVARSAGGVTITDLGSRNGVFVGERRLEAAAVTTLVDGERVRLGGCVLRLEDPAGRYLHLLDASLHSPAAAAAPAVLPGRPRPARAARVPILIAAALMCLAAAALLWLLLPRA
jgi:S-DNA-T family DNA segregation ATPase FtsK/SpoIIIE